MLIISLFPVLAYRRINASDFDVPLCAYTAEHRPARYTIVTCEVSLCVVGGWVFGPVCVILCLLLY